MKEMLKRKKEGEALFKITIHSRFEVDMETPSFH